MSHIRPNILDSPRMTPLLAAARSDNDVSLSFRIRADCSRVFYAISIPEYVEAWFRLPVEEGLKFVFNPIAQRAFRIDLYRAGAALGSIHSDCDIMNANQKLTRVSEARNSLSRCEVKI